MQTDRWIEKGDFRSKTKSGILAQWTKCLFDPIEQSDPRIPSEKSIFSTGCADRIARPKKVLRPTASLYHPRKHTITPYNSYDTSLTAICCCCFCSQRASVAHAVLHLPAARTVIPWQQCVLSMTFLQHRCCCWARFGDSQRVPTPQLRR